MSAYSEKDLHEAFRCSERGDFSGAIEAVEGRVFGHLNGTCTCDVARCKACGKRATNGLPRHEPRCPSMGMS